MAQAPYLLTDPAIFHISAEERLRIACRAASIGVWQWDLATGAMQYTRIAKEIMGFPVDAEVTIDRVRAATHPEDLGRTSAAARRALDPALKENAAFIYRVIREDTGETRWVQAFGEAQFRMVGGVEKAVLYVGTIQDITAQKLAEGRLVESEARLRLAIEAGRMAVWETDPHDLSVRGSPDLNRLFGFPPEAVPSLAELRSRYAPGERERIEREGQAALAAGRNDLQTTARVLWPDGTEKWLLMRAQLVATVSGAGERAIGVLLDVTDSKRLEERLAVLARELRHRLLNAYSVIGVIAKRTFRNRATPAEEMQEFQSKLIALGRVTELLFAREGAAPALRGLIEAILAPYQDEPGLFELDGPDITLPGKTAGALSMALHELCTNAVKHGAMSVAEGRVRISWRLDGAVLDMVWVESGGPAVEAPRRHGMGVELLNRGLVTPPDRIALDFAPEGVRCRILLHLDAAA